MSVIGALRAIARGRRRLDDSIALSCPPRRWRRGRCWRFLVTTVTDSGAGSLRQAILDANAAAGPDEIRFDIAGDGVKTIRPTRALPPVVGAVVIDGTSQPGYAGTPLVQLDGVSAGAETDGLTVAGDGVMRGLAVTR